MRRHVGIARYSTPDSDEEAVDQAGDSGGWPSPIMVARA